MIHEKLSFMNILHDKSQNCNASSNLKKSTSFRISEPLNHPKKTISYSIWVFFFASVRPIGPSPPDWSGGPFRLSFSKWLDAQGTQLWVVPSARPGSTSIRFVSQALGYHGIKRIPSSKLTYQWKIPIFNRKYIFKGSIFHCYVSLPEGETLESYHNFA